MVKVPEANAAVAVMVNLAERILQRRCGEVWGGLGRTSGRRRKKEEERCGDRVTTGKGRLKESLERKRVKVLGSAEES